MSNWYVVFVRGTFETKVKEALEREGYDAFIPMKEMLHRKEGVYKRVAKMMFPGYVFVECDDDYIKFNEMIKSLRHRTTGIIRNLSYDNDGTTPLTEIEVNLLMKLLGRNRVMEHSIGVIEGDKIIITEGPLAGFESNIIYIDRHKRQAILELDLLGHKTTTKVSLEIISKI